MRSISLLFITSILVWQSATAQPGSFLPITPLGPPALCTDKTYPGHVAPPPAPKIFSPRPWAIAESIPVAAWNPNGPPAITFTWNPGRIDLRKSGKQQSSRMTHYELLLYSPKEKLTQENVMHYEIDCARRSFHLPASRALLKRFQGKSLLWRLAACHGERCKWTDARPLHWRMPKPVLWSGRPQLSIQQPKLDATWSPVIGADRHAVCITLGPTETCEPDNLLQNQPWARSSAYDDPEYLLSPSDVRQFAGQPTYWSAAACRDSVNGLVCEWSYPQPLMLSADIAEIRFSANTIRGRDDVPEQTSNDQAITAERLSKHENAPVIEH